MPATLPLFQRVGGAFTPPPVLRSTPSGDLPSVPTVLTPLATSFTPTIPPAADAEPNDLDLLEKTLAEVEQIAPQAIPTALLQTVANAQAAQAAQISTQSGSKESSTALSPDAQTAAESGQSVQYVEYEPNPELPPEVEGYLNRVEQHADQAPREIVIADSVQPMPTEHPLPAQPVVVLPITPEIEKVGAAQSPKFSIRWLVEWSHKIMKVFVGKVIYRAT